MKPEIEGVDVEHKKYRISLREDYSMEVLRGGKQWVSDPPGSKMLISILHELLTARKLLADISFDFDPCKVSGPPCGPEMLARIKEYEERYGSLRDY